MAFSKLLSKIEFPRNGFCLAFTKHECKVLAIKQLWPGPYPNTKIYNMTTKFMEQNF